MFSTLASNTKQRSVDCCLPQYPCVSCLEAAGSEAMRLQCHECGACYCSNCALKMYIHYDLRDFLGKPPVPAADSGRRPEYRRSFSRLETPLSNDRGEVDLSLRCLICGSIGLDSGAKPKWSLFKCPKIVIDLEENPLSPKRMRVEEPSSSSSSRGK